MSTIKITQLPLITQLNSNTSNTLLVAVDSHASNTVRFSATTLAASLYANNVLNLSIKGLIHTPNIYPSSQTAITIDFANNSLVRAQTSTGLAVTLSNLVRGKTVEMWITNTDVSNQTLTHGISAINSTSNSTTYAMPASSSVFVKYCSMDGTLVNTFVSIVHA